MAMETSQDCLPFAVKTNRYSSEPRNGKPVSSKSVEQIETEMLLEELAELIESEDGILVP